MHITLGTKAFWNDLTIPPLTSRSLHPSSQHYCVSPIESLGSATGHTVSILLPHSVQQALLDINGMLSEAPQSLASSVTHEIEVPSHTDANGFAGYVEAFARELYALYFPKTLGAPELSENPLTRVGIPRDVTHRWHCALTTITHHFQDVAAHLQSAGYSRLFVSGTRNSFADHFHVHDFYTYILYCGREFGTEVILGDLEHNNLTVEERKDSWKRHTHRVHGVSSPSTPPFASATNEGLLIPPRVAHRACRTTSVYGQSEANLALVLTAFRSRDNSP